MERWKGNSLFINLEELYDHRVIASRHDPIYCLLYYVSSMWEHLIKLHAENVKEPFSGTPCMWEHLMFADE